MYQTEKEIRAQYGALLETCAYFKAKRADIEAFRKAGAFSSVTFIGAGSSLCLSQSAALQARLYLDMPAYAYAAGDVMMNFPYFQDILKDTLLVTPSRSGNTTEVIGAVKLFKAQYPGGKVVSICANEGSLLEPLADMNLIMPWCFDDSVCQTRTVTNLYAANLMFIAAMAGRTEIAGEIKKLAETGEARIALWEPELKKIAALAVTKVCVLGDGAVQGIAAEAAMAFMEISQIDAGYYHILDVRHGPMVMQNADTLIILCASPHGTDYQRDLVADFQKKGCKVVAVGETAEALGADYAFALPKARHYATAGVGFILAPQLISLFQALNRGVNPDLPTGLAPWINLSAK